MAVAPSYVMVKHFSQYFSNAFTLSCILYSCLLLDRSTNRIQTVALIFHNHFAVLYGPLSKTRTRFHISSVLPSFDHPKLLSITIVSIHKKPLNTYIRIQIHTYARTQYKIHNTYQIEIRSYIIRTILPLVFRHHHFYLILIFPISLPNVFCIY